MGKKGDQRYLLDEATEPSTIHVVFLEERMGKEIFLNCLVNNRNKTFVGIIVINDFSEERNEQTTNGEKSVESNLQADEKTR